MSFSFLFKLLIKQLMWLKFLNSGCLNGAIYGGKEFMTEGHVVKSHSYFFLTLSKKQICNKLSKVF